MLPILNKSAAAHKYTNTFNLHTYMHVYLSVGGGVYVCVYLRQAGISFLMSISYDVAVHVVRERKNNNHTNNTSIKSIK